MIDGFRVEELADQVAQAYALADIGRASALTRPDKSHAYQFMAVMRELKDVSKELYQLHNDMVGEIE